MTEEKIFDYGLNYPRALSPSGLSTRAVRRHAAPDKRSTSTDRRSAQGAVRRPTWSQSLPSSNVIMPRRHREHRGARVQHRDEQRATLVSDFAHPGPGRGAGCCGDVARVADFLRRPTSNIVHVDGHRATYIAYEARRAATLDVVEATRAAAAVHPSRRARGALAEDRLRQSLFVRAPSRACWRRRHLVDPQVADARHGS